MLSAIMFSSIVAQLELVTGTSIPATHGEAMQAEFLRKVEALDKPLVRSLHGDRGTPHIAPYTLSPLTGRFQSEGRWLRLFQGETYWFRATGLTGEASGALARLAARCDHWDICGARFRIGSWLTRPGQHPWAGSATSADLWETAQLADAQHPLRIGLRFFSPTSFRTWEGNRRRCWTSLPLPSLFFGGLARRLSALHPQCAVCCPAEVSRVAVGRCRTETRAMAFRAHPQVRAGFLGDVEYLLEPTIDVSRRQVFHFLAGLAFYAGAGSRTTWGMGQVRREPVWAFGYRGPSSQN